MRNTHKSTGNSEYRSNIATYKANIKTTSTYYKYMHEFLYWKLQNTDDEK